METIAFTDLSGGYYQYEWDGVSPLPRWTNRLTPTAAVGVVKTIAGIKAAIDSHCSGMFSAGFVYGGATFQACVESQRRIAARTLVAIANKIDAVTFPWVAPHSDGWWDVNNVVLASTQTVDGFLAFAKAFSDYCSSCEKCKRDHKSALTAENCATYNYTTGWPVNP